ncbi:hypothetical protein M433DRAFT_155007 [Acidomyces richmondensis BFW]|nr:MAG: hypothetical protein FE78DRAFT_91530 [Acidomyces sp. 'richmondensis']KYG44983.1 hypothetical protein M433DRAFT_155007 [Acidomyces richmondensis BFW]
MVLSLRLFQRALACWWGLRFARLTLAYLCLKGIDLPLKFSDVCTLSLTAPLLIAPDTGKLFVLRPCQTMVYARKV